MTTIDPGVTLPQGTAALASGSTGSGGVGPSATLGTANGTRAADPAAPPPPNLLAASLPAQAQEDREVSAATCEPAQPRELSLMEKVQGAQERLAFAESHAALANVPSRVSELLREIQTLDTEFAEKSARLKIARSTYLADSQTLVKTRHSTHTQYDAIPEALEAIRTLTADVSRLGEQKVAAATEMYDLLDQTIATVDEEVRLQHGEALALRKVPEETLPAALQAARAQQHRWNARVAAAAAAVRAGATPGDRSAAMSAAGALEPGKPHSSGSGSSGTSTNGTGANSASTSGVSTSGKGGSSARDRKRRRKSSSKRSRSGAGSRRDSDAAPGDVRGGRGERSFVSRKQRMEALLTTAEASAVAHLDVATISENWQEDRLRAASCEGGDASATAAAAAATAMAARRSRGPVYCFCRRPAFGEMIGCDDDACLLEWFHYDCVGLRVAPKSGKWFCADCTSRRSIEQAKRKLLKRKMAESQMGASAGSSQFAASEGGHSSGSGSSRRRTTSAT